MNSRKLILPVVGLAVLALLESVGWAESGPELYTGDTELLAPGRWEWVTGLNYARGGGARALAMPEVEISYGLNARWQLTAEFEHELLRPAGGATTREFEGSLGAKWLAGPGRVGHWAVALAPQVQFDTAPGLSLPQVRLMEDVGYRLPLLFAKTIGKVKLGAELGRTWRTKREDQWSAGLACEREFGDDVEFGVEVYSLWSPRFSRGQVALDGAAAIELTKHWQLLVTLGRDVRNEFGPRASLRSFLGVRRNL